MIVIGIDVMITLVNRTFESEMVLWGPKCIFDGNLKNVLTFFFQHINLRKIFLFLFFKFDR